MNRENLLIVADSEHDANMLYAVRMFVPDPFIYLRIRGKCKNAEEVKKISAALIMAEVGLAEGIQALKVSKVGRNRRLLYHDAPLTSEKLRSIIGTAILQAGGLASRTIVAGGKQGCDP